MKSTCREILKGKSENGQWAYCHDWVDPQPFYQNCLTDLCNSNSRTTKCNAFAAYTRACMVTQPYSLAYDKLCGISSHFNCDPKCGEGQMFKGCAKPCMDIGTCSNPPVDPVTDIDGFQKCAMDKEKVSSCVCRPGHLFSTKQQKCITKNTCGLSPPTTQELTTTPKPGVAKIVMSKQTYTTDEKWIEFTFWSPKYPIYPADAWIGIIPASHRHGSRRVTLNQGGWWGHKLGGATTGTVKLSNQGVGQWTVRLYDSLEISGTYDLKFGKEITYASFSVY